MKKMKLRKVKFKRWIPYEYHPKNEYEPRKKIEGTGQFENIFVNDGFFHEWGVNFKEFEANAGNISVALIEYLNGVVHEVFPGNFKFIND